ncbi:MAG: hypothetical protein DKM50_00845 [Candidatus Margulisiibacteriota bacterium]|nr:MAG: hypothetical protein A2X43_05320 [Candidatus Margulisbacteria bacterium GWD2_39_127]PZM83963.1 MAG: hypothetical protein DKM50_00845 [Candidatus Margulisiibacteriota bacterium]HAR64461.1 hypothetical protein [Candidatus Margulisiibacteriota bacterium]HCY36490.1 hypothetical protein [Candidatus Margulisiibacteriota bacterium]
MNKLLIVTAALVLVTATGCTIKDKKAALNSPKEKYSYAIGMSIGTGITKQKLDLDPKIISKGIQDAFAGKTKITEEEMAKILTEFQTEQRAAQEKNMLESGKKNLELGQKYLEQNKSKEGVKTLSSGIQYKVIKSGTGASPKLTDTVKVHYSGRLIDGKEFDSSYKRNEPVTFPLNGVIPGWTEILQIMKPGDKWEVTIPSQLAYGDRGAPPQIEPNSVLVFDIELVGIETAGK